MAFKKLLVTLGVFDTNYLVKNNNGSSWGGESAIKAVIAAPTSELKNTSLLTEEQTILKASVCGQDVIDKIKSNGKNRECHDNCAADVCFRTGSNSRKLGDILEKKLEQHSPVNGSWCLIARGLGYLKRNVHSIDAHYWFRLQFTLLLSRIYYKKY